MSISERQSMISELRKLLHKREQRAATLRRHYDARLRNAGYREAVRQVEKMLNVA